MLSYCIECGATVWQRRSIHMSSGITSMFRANMSFLVCLSLMFLGFPGDDVFGDESSLTTPKILGLSGNQFVNVGQTITLSVTAEGTEPLHFQWIKEGTNIAGANSPSLTLTNVHANDSGRYRVVISNEAGAVTGAVQTVTVNYALVDSLNVTEFRPNALAFVVRPDGSFYIGGASTNPAHRIVRVTSDGIHDTSFVAGTNRAVNCMALQSDGKILVGEIGRAHV